MRNWVENLENLDSLQQLIDSDLKALQQMAYIAVFEDNNKNNSIDFNDDAIIQVLDYIKMDVPFDYKLYTSYMDAPT